jgi:3D (Asp-Asp-Asp) domain-containing protein
VAWSAVLAKQANHGPLLAAIDLPRAAPDIASMEGRVVLASLTESPRPVEGATTTSDLPLTMRWFDGRPVRPARTIWMTVTAYSPDARSCGKYADGKTATLHSVWANGMKLVAADTRILPYGSMVSVPGYDSERIVPVLDCGGAIKGHRLDLLMPTHGMARAWGVKRLPVVVWEYADGKPATDPRKR